MEVACWSCASVRFSGFERRRTSSEAVGEGGEMAVRFRWLWDAVDGVYACLLLVGMARVCAAVEG